MTYTPKSKRGKFPTVPAAEHLANLASEEDALNAMFNLVQVPAYKPGEPGTAFDIIAAAMFAAKHTCDETQQRVFVQDFAASLNRRGLLSNTNVQPFREYAYQYMRGYE